MSDFHTVMASYERRLQAVRKANELNKTIVFDALAAAGITEITVTFDGYGDSGQIEDITAHMGEAPKALPAPAATEASPAAPAAAAIPLPKTRLTLHQAPWNREELGTYETTLQCAIEDLCYGYLEQEHDGWENNDGAFGEFRFNVAERSIELEFNGRFTDTYTENHSF